MAVCEIKLHVEPPCRIVLTGSHGERLALGLSEPATAERLSPEVCEDFRNRVLEAFGPGGRRRLTIEVEDASVDPRWLGPNPAAALDPDGMYYPEDGER